MKAGRVSSPFCIGLRSNIASRKRSAASLTRKRQKAFIEAYENFAEFSWSRRLGCSWTRASYPCRASGGCWAPAKDKMAIEQISGRQRLNIHGAIDLETGKTAMIDVEIVGRFNDPLCIGVE